MSRLNSEKQVKLIEHFVAGTTARCAEDLIDVNQNPSICPLYLPQSLRFESF